MSGTGFEPALDRTIESSPRAPAEARRAVEEIAPELEDAGLLRDIQLLVSELVTNSVRHSGSRAPVRLRVWPRPSGVKVEVADGGFGFATDDPRDEEMAESGRGLLILDALTDRWGVNRDGQTRVWFELSGRPHGVHRAQSA